MVKVGKDMSHCVRDIFGVHSGVIYPGGGGEGEGLI